MPTRAIKSIFFTRFHHEKGSRVLHEVPEGSITPSTAPSALPTPLFDFDSVTTYLIPTQQFCDRLLTFCTNHYRVLGYPVCIREGKYSRNEFIFNFAVVLEEEVADWVAYGEVVRKLGRLLRGLEEQGGFLSREEVEVWEDEGGGEGAEIGVGRMGGSKVYALCEMVLEDLNNYAECMIPIDDSNTINLKLFPTHPHPPPIYPYHVPILTISLTSLTSPISSDLTLTRIIPFINGIHSVSHIAQLADTDLSLTRKALQHLVYYGCLMLLDIFSFSAVYAPTAEIGGFVMDRSVQEECARYVHVPRMSIGRGGIKMGSSESEKLRDPDERSSLSSEASQQSHDMPSTITFTDFEDRTTGINRPGSPSPSPRDKISHETLITLYTSLRQGLSLKNWVLENLDALDGIDIRRLITFGIIKGFLYRVHKYAIATSSSSSIPPAAPPSSLQTHSNSTTNANTNTNTSSTLRGSDQSTVRGRQHPHHHSHSHHHPSHHKPSLASTGKALASQTARPGDVSRLDSLVSENNEAGGGLPLVRFLDGMHCFDEICSELQMSEKMVEEKIKGAGEVSVVMR